MLRDKNILCISSIDWDFIWQGHQEIMAMLAASGNQVLFVENTGVRRPTLRDLPRLRHRLRSWWLSIKGFRHIQDSLFVYSPLVLPFPYSRLARWINRAMLGRSLQRWMRATGFYQPIVWTFLPTPLARDVIKALDPALTVYYCIDDLASSSVSAHRITASEIRVFREADLVFVTSEKLRERAARFSDRVHLFPFAVDFERFQRVRRSADEVPEDLRGLRRPVVGYVGGVHRWMDQDLLATVARRMPEVSFALIGPLQTDVAALRSCANVHLLGPRPHQAVPHYIKGFDVGIVPYRLSEYTSHVYPTKLNEYLAMGIPVVSVDLAEVRRFNAENGEVVSLSHDADSFEEAIRRLLKGASPGEAEQRIEIARQNSWRIRIAEMSQLIEEALEIKRSVVKGTWEQAIGSLYRSARRRSLRTVVGLVAAYLLLFYTPFVWVLAMPLRVVEAPRQADAIVVFAAGVGESGKAGGGYQERVKQAVDLYRAGRAEYLILSSGYSFIFPEADVMRDLAEGQGVPASAIILETKSASTYQNVLFTRDILARRGWREVLLVSSPYHMRRALLTWRKVAPEVRVTSVPVPHSQFYARNWGASLEQIRGILHEYAGIVLYWWRGWI